MKLQGNTIYKHYINFDPIFLKIKLLENLQLNQLKN